MRETGRRKRRSGGCWLDFSCPVRGGSKVQLRRKEGSKYAGQVGGEWPTKFWKRVKSGSCLFTRMKKRILSRGGGGGRLSRNLEHTLRTLNTFYGCGTLFLSLSLSLVRSLARFRSLFRIFITTFFHSSTRQAGKRHDRVCSPMTISF